MDRQTIQRIRGAQELGEDAFDALIDKVQEMHYTYSGIPFAVLERIPIVAVYAKGVDMAHQVIADGVYHSIRVVNHLIGSTAALVLDQMEERMNR